MIRVFCVSHSILMTPWSWALGTFWKLSLLWAQDLPAHNPVQALCPRDRRGPKTRTRGGVPVGSCCAEALWQGLAEA